MKRRVVRFLRPKKDTHLAINPVSAHNLRIRSWCYVHYVDISTHKSSIADLAEGFGVGAKCGS